MRSRQLAARWKWSHLWLAGSMVMLVCSGCDNSSPTSAPNEPTPTDILSAMSAASQRLASELAPSVVRIETAPPRKNGEPTNELSQWFDEGEAAATQGSGFVVSADGHILTNYHVVRDAEVARVVLDEDRKTTARVIGRDALTDLALIKIDADGLVPVRWGDSEALQPGEFLWVMGNPFGLQRSITFGILSARQGSQVSSSPYYDFLQTDAVVNPGNSGGPLINVRGEVVGVTTTIVGTTYQGVSFAIPSQTAKEVLDQLLGRGKVTRGWLGLTLAPVSSNGQQPTDPNAPRGVLVLALPNRTGPPSPAAAAGIQPGDIILKWNDDPVDSVVALTRRVASTSIGTRVVLTVSRQGQTLTLPVDVAEHP